MSQTQGQAANQASAPSANVPSTNPDDYVCGAAYCHARLAPSRNYPSKWDCSGPCTCTYSPTTLKSVPNGTYTATYSPRAKQAAGPTTQAPQASAPSANSSPGYQVYKQNGHEFHPSTGGAVCKNCGLQISAATFFSAMNGGGPIQGAIGVCQGVSQTPVSPFVIATSSIRHRLKVWCDPTGVNGAECLDCSLTWTGAVLLATPGITPTTQIPDCAPFLPACPAKVPTTVNTFAALMKKVYGGPTAPGPTPSQANKISALHYFGPFQCESDDYEEISGMGHHFIRQKHEMAWVCKHCKSKVKDGATVTEDCAGELLDICVDCKRELCDAIDWSANNARWSKERCKPCRNSYEKSMKKKGRIDND